MNIEKHGIQKISSAIHLVRGHKVMLDSDLACLYGVETKYLKRQVDRNIDRFPPDFMFRLDKKEMAGLRCQIGTSSFSHGGARYLPYAFTEHGILMLSSVLNSSRAVQVNIAIMRAFVKLREVLLTHKALARKFSELERRVGDHDEVIQNIIATIRKMMAQTGSESEPGKPKGPIGFQP
ncbi:MAG: ORF6N domain-containing protein [Candidatus Omnitrophota bacterium]